MKVKFFAPILLGLAIAVGQWYATGTDTETYTEEVSISLSHDEAMKINPAFTKTISDNYYIYQVYKQRVERTKSKIPFVVDIKKEKITKPYLTAKK